MTRATPELAPPSPTFRATPTGGRLAATYDLACNRQHTRRIFSGIRNANFEFATRWRCKGSHRIAHRRFTISRHYIHDSSCRRSEGKRGFKWEPCMSLLAVDKRCEASLKASPPLTWQALSLAESAKRESPLRRIEFQ
ncbi:hypothetical protein AVEN_24996-1 [Araneus ventricosus]|uniref:Uncharacterized protein n=1 Tax=Araneus ventricosus TaxID=182803 RepID=A0A4Y2FH95_ARAVE|nr:hypothetical protein AVEN_24996-1 [Araneus ventricosus]